MTRIRCHLLPKNPIPPPIVHDGHGGDEQTNNDDVVDSGTPTSDDADSDGQAEQV